VPGTEDNIEGAHIRCPGRCSTARSGPEETMNRALRSRVERLETRYVPVWEPLRVVLTSIPSDYVIRPGERIVQDEFLEGQDQRYPLMLTVYERITTDPKDHGKRWSDQV
jgi:hypothetical protein